MKIRVGKNKIGNNKNNNNNISNNNGNGNGNDKKICIRDIKISKN